MTGGNEDVAAVTALEDRVREVRVELDLLRVSEHDAADDRPLTDRPPAEIARLPVDERPPAIREPPHHVEVETLRERVQQPDVECLAPGPQSCARRAARALRPMSARTRSPRRRRRGAGGG